MKQDGSVEDFVSALEQLRAVAPDEAQQTTIETIFSDLGSADCNVVVVGEFNRGKSTLVNAFLGEAILPCDVVPTTANIHKIRYSDNPKLKVYGRNGRVEEEAMTARQLRAFAAGNDLNADDVEFLELGLPLPQLEGLCIVDTPGVNDLNAHRCEVTYSFVPRADAVVFLLDARSPVRAV
jgi:predicted GTPase